MPITIKQGSTVKATYTYLADGTKTKVVNALGAGFDYIGSFKYNRSNSNITLESVATAGGRTYKTSSGYEARYFISDHLGSTRLVASANGTVSEQNDYMPYGDRHANSALAASTNPYLYNGKESQKDFGINYIDSEARFQRLDGAFNSIDPLCEKYYYVSPYAYCAANPISRIDTNGHKWVDANGNVMWSNGKWNMNASRDAMRLGVAMRSSPTGLAVFNQIANSPTLVKIEISPEIMIRGNSLIRGEFIPDSGLVIIDESNQMHAKSGKIIIYEGSIEAEISEKIQTNDETIKLIKTLPTDTAKDTAIGSVGVHEGTHLTPDNISLQKENKDAVKAGLPRIHDIEIDPIRMQNNYLKEELKRLNKLSK